MSGLLDHFAPGRPCLLLVAAPAEYEAVLEGRPSLLPRDGRLRSAADARLTVVLSGVGKVNAALAVAESLRSADYAAAVSLGIAGALPETGLDLGDTVIAERSVYADEGILTGKGFIDCAAMGFPLGPFDATGITGDTRLLDCLAGLGKRGVIATVSTCSGTDLGASMIRARSWAIAEAMEGAAVGHAAARWGTPFAEVRVISNTTGDRERQSWAIKRALARVGEIAGRL
ncbi:MAG: futalosine hydrolase [Phycisphaerales bacterium]